MPEDTPPSPVLCVGSPGRSLRLLCKGFTLIELLVTLTILSLLFVLLASGVKSMRAQANAVRCANHLRVAGVAFGLYAADHKGMIQLHRYGAALSPTTLRWHQFLLGPKTGDPKYLDGNGEIATCPGAEPWKYNSKTTGGYVYGTIGMANPNDPYSFTPPGSPSGRTVRLYNIDHPSRYWLLCDSWAESLQNQIYIIRDDNTLRGRIHLRHQKRGNLLFADGHVEALGLNDIAKLPYNPLPNAYDENKAPRNAH